MAVKDLVLTCGDPAGCGPLVALEAIQNSPGLARFILIGDREVLKGVSIYRKVEKRLILINAATPGIKRLKKGFASSLSGEASLNYLRIGLSLLKKNNLKRLVTAPLSKEAVKLTLKNFSGHTEFLADYFKVKNAVMMMVSGKLKVVLLTRHIPLREVAFSLYKKEILISLERVYSALERQFKIRRPKIAFASVNPHAGINTFLGKEEQRILEAIKGFKKPVEGPYPADTIFTPENLKQFHCIICPYHDQAMIAFKLLAMHTGVNLTLGLPIIRTSPAHGTAYDLVRNGKKPFSSSMLAAIKLALQLNLP